MTAEAKIRLSIDGTKDVVVSLNDVQKALDDAGIKVKYVGQSFSDTQGKFAGFKSGANESSHALDELSFKSAAAKRELLVLGHELASGNTSRFASSLLVLGERTGAASLLFSSTALTVGALAAGIGGLAYAVYEGHKDFELLNNTLKSTGDYTGKTIHDIDDMARRMISANHTFSDSREAIRLLIATGKVNGDQLQTFGQAALDMAKDTGKSIQDVVQDLAGMGDNPLKWAEKYNAQYHFLTSSQYLLAKSYEEAGNKAAAATVVIDALHDAHTRMFGDAEKNLGMLQRYYADWLAGIDQIKHALFSIGAPTLPEDQLQAAFKKREDLERELQSYKNSGDGISIRYLERELDLNKSLINGIWEKIQATKAAAKASQETANKSTQTQNLGHYLDDNKYADKGTKYSLDVKAENAAFALAVTGFEKTSAEYEQAFKRHKANLAAIAEQDAPKEQNSYKQLVESIKSATAANLQQLTQDDKISAGQKARIELNEKEAQSKGKLTAAEILAAHAASDAQLASEKRVQTHLGTKDTSAFIQQSGIARKASNDQLAIEYQLYGKTSDAREIAMIAIREETALEKFLQKEKQAGHIVSQDQIDLLRGETSARIAVEQATLSQGKALAYAQQLRQANEKYAAEMTGTYAHRLQAVLDNEAKVWRERIQLAGEGTEAQKELIAEFTRWYANQKTELTFKVKIEGLNDAADKFDSLSKLANSFGGDMKKISASLSGFGNAFKSLAHAEQEEHAGSKKAAADRIGAYGDMADAAAGFFNENSTGYKTLEDVSRAYHAVQMAMQLEQLAMNLESTVSGMAAGAAQMFAKSGWGGFVGVAAMIAVLASLGFRGGGNSGNVNIAQDRQASQGAGTVFGDSTAKSDSLAKSMDDLQKNSDQSLPITQAMLTELQGINAAMTGLAQILFRTAGITAGNGLGIATGTTPLLHGAFSTLATLSSYGVMDKFTQNSQLQAPIVNMVNNALSNFFGHTSSSITDSGLTINGALGNISQGQGIGQYATVHTDTKSLFGLSHSSSDSTVYGAVDQTVANQIGKVFKGIEDTILTASSTFMSDTTGIQRELQNFAVSIPTISLRGLTGQALQDALNAVFSSFSDTLARTVIPGMDDFQRVGEGYYQTVIRIVNGVESADAALAKFGIVAINFKDIVSRQGDIAVEIMRQSIAAFETGSNGVETGVGKIVDAFSGTVQDLTSLYQSLLGIRKLMNDTNLNGQDLSASFIQGAGGVDAANSGLSTYLDKFFTPQEKAAAEVKDVAQQFALLGLQMPMTLQAFRALVGGIDTSTEAGQKLAGSIIALSDPFSTALQDATSGLNDMVSSLASFRDSLNAGSYSGGSAASQTAAARTALDRAYTLALSGDTSAANSIQGLAQTFLADSKVSSASQLALSMDVAAVKQMVNNVINALNTQASLAVTASTSTGTQSSSFISGDGTNFLTGNYSTELANKLVINGSHADGLNYVPFDNYLANLHEGEGVLTKEQNKAYQSQDASNAVVVELKEVRKALDQHRALTATLLNRFRQVTQDGTAMLTKAAS